MITILHHTTFQIFSDEDIYNINDGSSGWDELFEAATSRADGARLRRLLSRVGNFQYSAKLTQRTSIDL